MIAPPKYPRTFHWPTSPGVQSDDKIHTRPERFIGREVTVTEKADGGCTILAQGEPWSRASGDPATEGWFAMVRKWHSWKTATWDPMIALYGEDLYGIHAIDYGEIPENRTFRPFNLLQHGRWLSYDDRIKVADDLEMVPVPLVFRGTFNSEKELSRFLADEIKKPSLLTSAGAPREGFVIQSVDEFAFEDFSDNVCKYVRANHVQSDTHWRYNWQACRLGPPV